MPDAKADMLETDRTTRTAMLGTERATLTHRVITDAGLRGTESRRPIGPGRHGAFSTARQAAGRAAMVIAGFGFGGTFGGFG